MSHEPEFPQSPRGRRRAPRCPLPQLPPPLGPGLLSPHRGIEAAPCSKLGSNRGLALLGLVNHRLNVSKGRNRGINGSIEDVPTDGSRWVPGLPGRPGLPCVCLQPKSLRKGCELGKVRGQRLSVSSAGRVRTEEAAGGAGKRGEENRSHRVVSFP